MVRKNFSFVDFLSKNNLKENLFPWGDLPGSAVEVNTGGNIQLKAISEALEINISSFSVRGCKDSDGYHSIRIEPLDKKISERALIIGYTSNGKILHSVSKVIYASEDQAVTRNKKLYPSSSFSADDENLAMNILRELKYVMQEGLTKNTDANCCKGM